MEDADSLRIPGYEFWIEVDGRRAKQFQTQECDEPADDGGNVVSCYIASEVGKEFRIGTRKQKDGQPISVRFYLNDHRVAKRVCKASRVNDIFVSHTHTAKEEKRKFVFSAINLEEDELAELSSIPKNLGCIRLEVFRITNVRKAIPKQRFYPADPNMLNVPALSEKSKIVKLHTISLQKPEAVKELGYGFYDFDYFDSSPWYTVKFLYRPLGVLQAEGIAPILSPDASETDETDDQQSESESSRDEKPFIKTIKSETPSILADGSKATEPIVIMDSDDEEDSKCLRGHAIACSKCSRIITRKLWSLKRSRELSDTPVSGRTKRVRKTSVESVVIVLDSD